MEIYNPIELNDTVKDDEPQLNIFYYQNDIGFIDKTNFMIIDIDNYDSGTLLEFGYISALKKQKPGIKIIVYSSDFRNQLNWSERMNRFLDGMIQCNATLVHNEADLMKEVESFFKTL
ncbi:nucleoside 2-deoxyribosyltransferase [Mycoplasmopsis adleri]|uniref:nucleoside 2-deoxyribosyltransferase n=1 Tax=Mycoplasmopsis adleri TaxID=51362 RepID=UPI0038730A79